MITIKAPLQSFYQFGTQEVYAGCGFEPFTNFIGVYADTDVAFQFVLMGDTKSEIDTLCDLHNDKITIGISRGYGQNSVLNFTGKTERYRLSDTQVLYNWSAGLPGFTAQVQPGKCFNIRIAVDTGAGYVFWSNGLERLESDCYTTVIEYGNDDDGFGFNYCNGSPLDADAPDCSPVFITFDNLTILTIPYTSTLRNRFGDFPTVKIWFRADDGTYYDPAIRVNMDNYPPNLITADLGGNASGVARIS